MAVCAGTRYAGSVDIGGIQETSSTAMASLTSSRG